MQLCTVLFFFVLERRQTMLFSATQTRKIEDLARISLKKEPLYIGVDDQKDKATVEGLEQVCITSMLNDSTVACSHTKNCRCKYSKVSYYEEVESMSIDILTAMY